MTINNKDQEKLFLNEYTYSALALPEDIHLCAYHFNIANYSEGLYPTLHIRCPDSIRRSVKKRQAEYLAGRFAATKVFQRLDRPNIDIPIGKNRSPVWPQDIVASISHNNTTALCAAACKNNYQYLGIDIETKLSQELVTEIKDSIINKNEELLLLKHESSLSFTDAFTLVFSAKESLFKALHPEVNFYFDFSAAELISLCNKTNQFELVLLQDLTSKLRKKRRFIGTFSFDETQVITLIAQ